MAPFVPEIINPDINLLVALLLGFFFGFVLEQAGFSNSRKLVGLFYGYDFVVLRVFFTAGVTAMLGLLFLGNIGWVDTSELYIQPTFLYSALLGGAIMGLGFIIGGYCPGTSVTGAAIGKIDAMLFIVGSAVGIFIFGMMYDNIYSLYTADDWGGFTMYNALDISPGVFAFLLTSVALIAFIFTKKIEDKVNNRPAIPQKFFANPQNKYVIYGLIYVAFSIYLIAQPSYEQKIDTLAQSKIEVKNIKAISPIQLIYRVTDGDQTLQIIDLRSNLDSGKVKFPAAKNMKYDDVLKKIGRNFINNSDKSIVFIDDDQTQARKAAIAAAQYSGKQIYYLQGGINNLIKEFNDNPTVENAGYQETSKYDTYLFKSNALAELKKMVEEYEARNKTIEVKKSKVAGGC